MISDKLIFSVCPDNTAMCFDLREEHPLLVRKKPQCNGRNNMGHAEVSIILSSNETHFHDFVASKVTV